MKNLAENFTKEIFKTIIHIALIIGVPIYMLTNKYDIYETVKNNPLSNKLTVYGIVITLILLVALKYIVGAVMYSSKMNTLKKLWLGTSNALPYIGVYIFAMWLSNNMDFVKDMMLWTAVTNSISFIVAPEFILNMKQKKG